MMMLEEKSRDHGSQCLGTMLNHENENIDFLLALKEKSEDTESLGFF